MEKVKKTILCVGDFTYRFRYAIALLAFAVCILFEISGSSISTWQDFIGIQSTAGTGDLLGKPRLIRSDEWAVNTPMAFSQYFNQEGAFPYFSDTLRGTKTDAFIIYGQPVRSWEVIFRPFQWGYLLFAPARGLSFFWCGRLLALFLISLEMGVYLFKKKTYAVAYTFLLTLSPMVQWWFAINGLVEMLVFGQAALLLIAAYLNQKNYLKKFFLMLGLVLCAGGYILVFYPPWQIPLGYAFLFLMIGLIIREFKKECWCWKKDLLIAFTFFLLLGISMGAIVSKSWDTIQTVMNTAYPGAREFTGGGAFRKIMNWGQGILLPFLEPAIGGTNVCEEANIISFFPMGIIIGLWVIIKEKKRDPMLISLFTGTVFLTSYCIVPWPSILAKITLMSNCQPKRVILAAGFLSLILLFYAAKISEKGPGKIVGASTVIVLTGGITYYLYKTLPELYTTESKILATAGMIFICFFAVALMLYKKYNGIFLAICISVALVSGAIVNPIHKGVDVIYTNPLVQTVSEVVRNDDANGIWIVENMGFPLINLPIMVGAPTINCTNTYPDMQRWGELDKDGTAEQSYNRYAHISIKLDKIENVIFENPETSPDVLNITLPPTELENLNVKFILSNRDLTEFNTDSITFSEKTQVGNYRIYEITYAGDNFE